jgi:hypothetical protein
LWEFVYVDPVVVLVVALIAAVSVIAGLLAAILHRADGATLPASLRAGGTAFAATLALALAVVTAARGL